MSSALIFGSAVQSRYFPSRFSSAFALPALIAATTARCGGHYTFADDPRPPAIVV
jgi:hypothetical protein